MKSFKSFINESPEGRKEYMERMRTVDLSAARKKLERTPVLTDDEMRAQNPGATAAYERTKKGKFSTPEGRIEARGLTKGGNIEFTDPVTGKTEFITPDEAIARAERSLELSKKYSGPSTTPKQPPKKQARPTVSISATRKPLTVDKGPSVKVSTPTSKAKSINLGDTSLPKTSKAPKGNSISVSTPKPKVATTTSAKDVGKVVTDVLQKERSAKKAEKAAQSVRAAKTIRNLGTAAGIVGAGFDAKQGYDVSRAEGGSKRRSLGAGAARALGGLAGGAAGSVLGSALGLPGAVIGGTTGYAAGTELGTKAYKAITGDVRKKVTTQGVLSNIRKSVPYEIRSQVPQQARKTFTDFVKTAGRTYSNWEKSQRQGGNK